MSPPVVVESYDIKYVKFKIETLKIKEGSIRLGQIIDAMEQIKE